MGKSNSRVHLSRIEVQRQNIGIGHRRTQKSLSPRDWWEKGNSWGKKRERGKKKTTKISELMRHGSKKEGVPNLNRRRNGTIWKSLGPHRKHMGKSHPYHPSSHLVLPLC